MWDEKWYSEKPWSYRYSAEGEKLLWIIDTINSRTAPALPAPTPLLWATDGIPDWANLVEWLKLYHVGKIEGYELDGSVRIKHRVLKSGFGIVHALRGQHWSTVVQVLKELRTALIAVEGGWAIQQSDDEVMEDGMGDEQDDEQDVRHADQSAGFDEAIDGMNHTIGDLVDEVELSDENEYD